VRLLRIWKADNPALCELSPGVRGRLEGYAQDGDEPVVAMIRAALIYVSGRLAHQVEGVILGRTDKICGVGRSGVAKPKP